MFYGSNKYNTDKKCNGCDVNDNVMRIINRTLFCWRVFDGDSAATTIIYNNDNDGDDAKDDEDKDGGSDDGNDQQQSQTTIKQ